MQQVRVGLSAHSESERCRPFLFQNCFRTDQQRRRNSLSGARLLLFLMVGCCAAWLLSGCGVAVSGGLSVSPGTLSFGAVPVGQSAAASITVTNLGASAVTIQQLSVAGQSFSIIGTTSLPITIPAQGSYKLQVQFSPAGVGAATGQLTVDTNAATGGSAAVSLNGTGMQALTTAPAPVLSSLSCSNLSLTGSGKDSCTVTLSSAAASGGLSVSLSSSNPAVTVPSSVTVPAGATSAPFAASVSAVASTQAATLTASLNGVDASTSLQLDAATSVLVASVANLAFGNVALNTTAQQTVALTSAGSEPVTITQATLSGAAFTFSGVNLPIILNPNQVVILTVSFDPAVAGNASGQLQIISNAASGGTINVQLSGAGTTGSSGPPSTPVLNGFSCTSSSVSGAGTVNCAVTLSAAAPAGGLAVTVTSNNTAVVPPGVVTVAAGSTTEPLTAAVSAVTSAQTAVLMATAGGVSESFSLQLNPSGAVLTINATSVAFGDVSLNTTATQSVVLGSVGSLPVTVSAIAVTGSGFSAVNPALPLTLNPGQTVTLNIAFDPTVTGLLPGLLTITSNATSNPSIVVSLSGTGATAYSVALTWDAPVTSSDPVVGYNVYRSEAGGSVQLLNASVNLPTTFVDSKVQNGVSYVYYVTSVDSSGVESVPSNSYSVSIP